MPAASSIFLAGKACLLSHMSKKSDSHTTSPRNNVSSFPVIMATGAPPQPLCRPPSWHPHRRELHDRQDRGSSSAAVIMAGPDRLLSCGIQPSLSRSLPNPGSTGALCLFGDVICSVDGPRGVAIVEGFFSIFLLLAPLISPLFCCLIVGRSTRDAKGTYKRLVSFAAAVDLLRLFSSGAAARDQQP